MNTHLRHRPPLSVSPTYILVLSLPQCFAVTMPPTHPDDEYLFEFDLDEKGRMQFDTDGQNPKFSDRAKAAQEAVRMTPPRV